LHSSDAEDPLAAYRLKRADSDCAFEDAASRAKFFGALVAIAGAALFIGFVYSRGDRGFPAWLLAAPLLVAAPALRGYVNARVKSTAFFRVRCYYEAAIARLTRDWDAIPAGEEYADANHLYAADLNLFGRASLFQVMCSARTRAGRDTLARWMKEPAGIEECLARAEAVRELREGVDLREALAAAGPSRYSDFRIETFGDWAQPAEENFPVWAAAAALLLSCAVLGIGAACLLAGSPALLVNRYVMATLGLEAVFALLFAGRVRAWLKWIAVPAVELPVICEVVRILEERPFHAPRLAALSERLKQGGSSASCELGRLWRLVTLLNQRENPMFTLPSYALLWGTQFVMAIARWRRKHGASMVPWLEAVGEFEALISMGTYASEHPGDVFPEFMATGPVLEAQAIGHPLLGEDVCVRSDFELGDGARLVVVSGSNMSGKSTFLRAVALNAAMARMGAPVRCARLRLSDLQVGASILVQDSLAEGRSHFLAELERLRQIIVAAGRWPLLFVIDEILIGTNSRDRAVAAEWVARALMARGAVGLISTHDLALTGMAESPRFSGANFHFADTGDPSGLVFDYRLRPGVVERSNALSIARSLGIETGEGLA
jgi:hypothetical protein